MHVLTSNPLSLFSIHRCLSIATSLIVILYLANSQELQKEERNCSRTKTELGPSQTTQTQRVNGLIMTRVRRGQVWSCVGG